MKTSHSGRNLLFWKWHLVQNKGRKFWPKDTFIPGPFLPSPMIPSSWSPGLAEGWFLCKSLWIQICDSSNTAGGTRLVFRFSFWYSQHWLLFLPLLKKTAIFDNIPLWYPDLLTEEKHCAQTGALYKFWVDFAIKKAVYIHGYRAEKLNFQELSSSRDSHTNKHSFPLQPPN